MAYIHSPTDRTELLPPYGASTIPCSLGKCVPLIECAYVCVSQLQKCHKIKMSKKCEKKNGMERLQNYKI